MADIHICDIITVHDNVNGDDADDNDGNDNGCRWCMWPTSGVTCTRYVCVSAIIVT